MTDFNEKIPPDEAEPPVSEVITTEKTETIPPEPIPESRRRAAVRSFSRWALSLLIAFGLGALVIYFVYLVPSQRDLDQSVLELDEVTEQVDSLTEDLDEVRQTNQELEAQLSTAQAQVILLGAITDARAANLAIANDDYAGALLFIKDAARSLEQLEEVIEEDQREVITAMQDNLSEIEDDLRNDPEAARMSLDRLTANLVKLEGSLIR